MSNDEDMDFVLDSYQSAMSPIFKDDHHVRSVLLKKIAKRRAPRVLPILNQIDNILDNVKMGTMTEQQGIWKMLKISEHHSHPDLHQGIMAKVGNFGGNAPMKSVALFSSKKKKQKGLFTPPRLQGKPKKGDWDPMTSETHPLASLMKSGSKKSKPTSRGRMKGGWDPRKDEEHPLASLFKKGKK